MKVSLTEPRPTHMPLQPKLDGPGRDGIPDPVVWLAGRGHGVGDGARHIDFPMVVACDQS